MVNGYEYISQSGNFLPDVQGLEVHKVLGQLLVDQLDLGRIGSQVDELVLQAAEEAQGVAEGLQHDMAGLAHLADLAAQFPDFLDLLDGLELLPVALVLDFLPLEQELPPLQLLLFFLLQAHDLGVHLVEHLGELGVGLVDQVGEVGLRFVIDALEEHDGLEVLLEAPQVAVGQLLLDDRQDVLAVLAAHVLGQVHHFLLDVQQHRDLLARLGEPLQHFLGDVAGDLLHLIVGPDGQVVDVVADGDLGTLGNDVQNVPALHEVRVLYARHDVLLELGGLERLVLVLLERHLEKLYPLLIHQVVEEVLLLLAEQEPSLVLEQGHLPNLLAVVLDVQVAIGPVDDEDDSLLDLVEGLEGPEKVLGQPGQLVRPGLRNVRLVDHQHDLHLAVDVQQPLHEERVRDFVLLPLIVPEPGAVVEGQVLNNGPGGDRGLRVLLMPDFDVRLGFAHQLGFEPLAADHELMAGQEVHDGALPHPSVADDDDGLAGSVLLGDCSHPLFDQVLQLVQVQLIFYCFHRQFILWLRISVRLVPIGEHSVNCNCQYKDSHNNTHTLPNPPSRDRNQKGLHLKFNCILIWFRFQIEIGKIQTISL